jgi:hypothetical protein
MVKCLLWRHVGVEDLPWKMSLNVSGTACVPKCVGFCVAEQKQKMREIRQGGKRSRTWVRNPDEGAAQANKKQSVAQAAAAFLAQAAKDLVPIQNIQNSSSSDG